MAPIHTRTSRYRTKAASPKPMMKRRTVAFLLLTVLSCLYCLQTTYAVGKMEKVMGSRMLAEERLKEEFVKYKKPPQQSFWKKNINLAEELLLDARTLPKVRTAIAAYLEPPMNDTIPNTGSQGDPNKEKDKGSPPQFYSPLPLRTITPKDLKKYEYPKFQTCHDLPAKLPVDRGLELDKNGHAIVRNIGYTPTEPDYPWKEAPYCPVEADPFLPWIHDLFPTADGKRIEFIAQNKRRCRSGRAYLKDIQRLEPQVALFQPVSVERIDEAKAQELAPGLWRNASQQPSSVPRYRLAPYEEASADGMWTRFICRFHTTDFETGEDKILDETLSEYSINYEFIGYRKNRPQLLTPKGRETNLFWTSTLMFSCPVPKKLQSLVSSGSTILSDGTPTLRVDVIPIRTPPRYGSKEIYFTEDMAGPRDKWQTSGALDTFNTENMTSNGFNATLRWGQNHVLPPVEASGRWANLPICRAPILSNEETQETGSNIDVGGKKHLQTEPQRKRVLLKQDPAGEQKQYELSACLWASASFAERGIREDSKRQKDTNDRLREWIEFHLLVGFDHIVVYDNSGAHTNETSLEPITSLFPPSKVTRVDWPSVVCNNNVPAHPNTGERSSQYAAENSCRVRYGPYTEWMASFDTDEYLVPMGNYTNLKDVVRDAEQNGTNILTLRSTRGKLRHVFAKETEYVERTKFNDTVVRGLEKVPNVTFLEAYNCDSSPLPKSKIGDRAKKQIYRTDYVLNHFVHYSTVTKPFMEFYRDYADRKARWPRIVKESFPSERVTDELNEAVMVHTKRVTLRNSRDTEKRCHMAARTNRLWRSKGCYIGFPSPNGTAMYGHSGEDGMEYNCFINKKVENYWVPLLNERLKLGRDDSAII
eukprot:scaffold24174_cov117-Cylindrotheca_fusiformis.AAC.8